MKIILNSGVWVSLESERFEIHNPHNSTSVIIDKKTVEAMGQSGGKVVRDLIIAVETVGKIGPP